METKHIEGIHYTFTRLVLAVAVGVWVAVGGMLLVFIVASLVFHWT